MDIGHRVGPGIFATRPAEQCRTAGNSSESTTGLWRTKECV